MRSTFKLLFYINRNKVKSDGTTAVLCRISIDGKKSAVATGIYCRPEDWDSKKCEIRTVRENNRLAGFRDQLEKAYDNLLKHDIYIVAETKVAVDHALLGLPEASLEDIRRVYSHPQGLMQCSGYLGAHRQWSQISVENTAGAAKKVLEEGEVSQAAVASPTAGALYGLKVLEASINNNKNNTTRFIIVARKPMYRKDAGKVSICFEGLHKSGSLYNMLGNFIYNDVNMLMIESRPIEGRSWEYRFFVDVEGSLGDPAIRNALLGISEEAVSMRILGNY